MLKQSRARAGAARMSTQGVSLSSISGRSTEMTRTTLVLPVALDQNLELYSVKSGLPKGEVIKRVLIEYLTKQGFQPDKRPKSIDIKY